MSIAAPISSSKRLGVERSDRPGWGLRRCTSAAPSGHPLGVDVRLVDVERPHRHRAREAVAHEVGPRRTAGCRAAGSRAAGRSHRRAGRRRPFMLGLAGPRTTGQAAGAEPAGRGVQERLGHGVVLDGLEKAKKAVAVVVLGEVLPVADRRDAADRLGLAAGALARSARKEPRSEPCSKKGFFPGVQDARLVQCAAAGRSAGCRRRSRVREVEKAAQVARRGDGTDGDGHAGRSGCA